MQVKAAAKVDAFNSETDPDKHSLWHKPHKSDFPDGLCYRKRKTGPRRGLVFPLLL